MDPAEFKRLVVRHRHVAPMLSVLLAGTDARVVITDAEGAVILDRQAGPAAVAGPGTASDHFRITVEGETVGWVDGPRPAGAIASVLSYACSRETDKRALAREALDRYRELNLIYELADEIGATLEVDEVARVAVGEASRLPTGGTGFLLVHDAGAFAARPTDGEAAFPGADPSAGILGAIFVGDGEIVNDVAADPRATEAERRIASLVAAPLQVRGERIGIIGTMSTTPLEFRASDLKVLGAIASLAAPTLDQAAVHESVVTRGR
jgi:putative methionine-R-sulfoxide reductase with GAF domain